MSTKTVVEKAIQKAQQKTEPQPMERKYAYLDSIANAKRHSDIQRRRQEIDASERSMNVRPVNVTGQVDPFMTSQIAQSIAERREALIAVEALTGDDLVRHYCAEIVAQQENPGPEVAVTLNGEPLLRGAVPPSFAPGMQG